MEQIYALIKTEYLKRKNSYWLPVWIISGFLGLMLIALFIAMLANVSDIHFFNDGTGTLAARTGSYGLMFFFAMIYFIFLVLMSQSSLNRERQLGCDLFFRCQPVNIWRVCGVKYLMHVYGGLAWLAGLGIIAALIMAFIGLGTGLGFPLGQALYGSFLGLLAYLKVAVVIGSLLFLFSAVFTHNAFLKGVAVMGIAEGLLAVTEAIFRHQIDLPGIFGNLFAMVGNLNAETMDTVKMSSVMGDPRFVWGLLFAAACFLSATFIYRHRAKDSN